MNATKIINFYFSPQAIEDFIASKDKLEYTEDEKLLRDSCLKAIYKLEKDINGKNTDETIISINSMSKEVLTKAKSDLKKRKSKKFDKNINDLLGLVIQYSEAFNEGKIIGRDDYGQVVQLDQVDVKIMSDSEAKQ